MTYVITLIIQFLVACVATAAFAVLFTSPKSEVVFCGIAGGIGWLVYYIFTLHNLSVVLASVVGTFILAVLARALAVIRRVPATVYLLTGIFPLVPGAGIYYTAYYLFTGQNELFGAKGLETFEVACAIVFGIIFGFAIPQKLFQKLPRIDKSKDDYVDK